VAQQSKKELRIAIILVPDQCLSNEDDNQAGAAFPKAVEATCCLLVSVR
jgi:hypothetical protein